MKGSPFQRNFGIGSSPVKQGLKKELKQLKKTTGPEPKPTLDKNKNRIPDTVESIESKQGHIEKPPKKKKVSRSPRLPRLPESPVSPKARKEPITKPVPKINMPKGFAPNISDEQRAKSKGTLKGKTGFEFDVVDPVKSKLMRVVSKVAPKTQRVTQEMVDARKKRTDAESKKVPLGKKVKDYFTKK